MKHFDDIIDQYPTPYSEDLDMEDLAMIESIVQMVRQEDEAEETRKSIRREIDDLVDEF